jgi:hypothetical protein
VVELSLSIAINDAIGTADGRALASGSSDDSIGGFYGQLRVAARRQGACSLHNTCVNESATGRKAWPCSVAAAWESPVCLFAGTYPQPPKKQLRKQRSWR